MSDLWSYLPPVCDGHACPQDCDHCGYADKIVELGDAWCEKCRANKPNSYDERCFACDFDGVNAPTQFVPMSHREQLRYMTDEELAAFIAEHIDCCNCPKPRNGCSENDETCAAAWLEWLKGDAECG